MYKRQVYYIALLFFTFILAFGCTDTDPFPGEGDLSGDCEGAYVNLAFKMPSLPEVELRAKEPSRESEEAVSDLYMLVFDANGNRVNNVSKFYSKEELRAYPPIHHRYAERYPSAKREEHHLLDCQRGSILQHGYHAQYARWHHHAKSIERA